MGARLHARRKSVLAFATLGLAGLFAALLVACSGDDAVGPPSGGTIHVRGAAGFDPESRRIRVGDTVEWIWDEAGHTVTSSDIVGGLPGCTPNGLFDSGARGAGATFSFTFTAPGTYGYHCATGTHCAVGSESAVVVVQ